MLKLSEVKVKKPSKKIKRKIFTGLGLLLLFALTLVFLFSGDNVQILKELFKEDVTREEVQESLSGLGWRGYVGFGILSMLQVVLTFIPAEPVQVMAGISLGMLKGGLACLAGVFVGNTVLFVLYKIYGQRLTDYFSTNAEFDFDYARKSKRVAFIVVILYFLPAIPYGLICLFTASLNTRYPKYILLTTLGAIPSIAIGVGLGHLAMAASWILSAVIFAVLITLLIILFKKKSQEYVAWYESKTASAIPEEVAAIAEERWQARLNRDWAKSDELRAKLTELGYTVKDSKTGYELTKN